MADDACRLSVGLHPNDDICNLVYDIEDRNRFTTTNADIVPFKTPHYMYVSGEDSYCPCTESACATSREVPNWNIFKAESTLAQTLPACQRHSARTGACPSKCQTQFFIVAWMHRLAMIGAMR